MLFNVDEDPHELNNLVDDRPDIAAEGARRLLRWHDDMMSTQPFAYDSDPMDEILHETGPEHAAYPDGAGRTKLYTNYFQRLRETGREHWIDEIIRRHPELEPCL